MAENKDKTTKKTPKRSKKTGAVLSDRPILNFGRRLLDKLPGAIQKKNKQQQEEIRDGLTKIGNQGIQTVDILKKNLSSLEELGKDNAKIAELVKDLSKEGSDLNRLSDLQVKLVDGQDISSDEAKKFVSTLKDLTGTLNNIGIKLDVDLQDIARKTGELLDNDKLSMQDRRSILKQTVDQLSVAKEDKLLSVSQEESLNVLEGLNFDQISIAGDQRRDVQKVLTDIADDTNDVKISASLNELNNNLDQFALSQDELNETLDKKTDDGETVGDKFKKGLGSQTGKGILGFLASTVGLGGIEQLPLGGLLSGGAGLLGKAGGVFGKGSKALSGGLGKILGKGGALLGKIALPLAAIISVFDFAKGFANAAEVAGLEPGTEIDFATKIQAGVSSVLSGLTLGFVDSKDIFEKIDKGLKFIFGPDGLLDKGAAMLGKIVDFFANIEVGKIFDSITEGIGTLTDKGGKLLSTLKKKAFDFLPDFFSDESTAEISGIVKGKATQTQPAQITPVSENARVSTLLMEESRNRREFEKAMLAREQQPIIVPIPTSNNSTPNAPNKQTSIGDNDISLINSAVL